MDDDLMDQWITCAWGVDCETHRAALDEIQRLREERDAGEHRVRALEDGLTALRETIRGLIGEAKAA